MRAPAAGAAVVHEQCPRCGADVDGGVCSSCRLQLACPSCSQPLRRPERAQVCGSCGRPLRQPPWHGPATLSGGPRPSAGDLAEFLRAAEVRLTHARAPGTGPATPRQLRAQLAAQLARDGRLEEADGEYALAAAEPGTDPSPAELLVARAQVALRAGRRADALRLSVEAVLTAEQELGELLTELPSLIDPGFVERHGAWAAGALASLSEDVTLPAAARAGAASSEGMCLLLGGTVADSLPAFRRSAELRGGSMPALLDPSLDADSGIRRWLVERLGEGPAAWALAQVAHEVDRLDDALRLVDEALSAGLDGEDWPEAELYRFRARLRDRLDTAGVEEDLFAAGCRYGWREEYELAVALFAEAEQRGCRRPDLYWYWADDLRLLAVRPGTRTDLLRLNEADEVWRRGRALGDIAESDAWAYLVRGEIASVRAGADEATAPDDVWRGVADHEAAVALDPSASPWFSLAEQWGDLGYWAVRAHAHRRAMDLAGDADGEQELQQAREARVVHAFWLDRRDLAASVEAYRGQEGNSAWIDFVEGVACIEDDPTRAADLLDRSQSRSPDLRTQYHLARALLVGGRRAEALRHWDAVWDRIRPGGPADEISNWSYRVLAACVRGDWREGEHWAQWQEAHEERINDVSGTGTWLRVLPALCAGDTATVTELLARCRRTSIPPGELSMRHVDLECLDAVLHGDRPGDVVRGLRSAMSRTAARLPDDDRRVPAAVGRVSRLARRHLRDVEARATVALAGRRLRGPQGEPRALVAHIRTALLGVQSREPFLPDGSASAADDQLRAAERSDAWPVERLAHRARRCSLLLEQGHWQAAATAILAVERDEAEFPTAPLLTSAAESLRREIGRRAAETDFAAVRELATTLAEITSGRPDFLDVQAEALGCIALGLVLEHEGGAADVSRALTALAAAAPDEPAARLGRLWTRLLPDSATFWRLTDALAAEDVATAGPVPAELLDELLGFLTARFCGEGGDVDPLLPPVATPVVVQLGEAMLPEDAATTWPSWPLFTDYIPDTRDRMVQETGVTVPGFNVRGGRHSLPPEEYALLLDGAFRRRGQIPSGGWFVPDADALPAHARRLQSATDPRTGRAGAWVSPDVGREVRRRGGDAWDDPHRYVMADLERLLRDNLELYLRVDDVERLLDRGAEDDLVAVTVPTAEDRRRLAWVLRQVVRERHVLTDLPAVLSAFAAAAPDPAAQVQAVLAVTSDVQVQA